MTYLDDLAWIDYMKLCETLSADPAEQNEEFGYINRGIHRAGAEAVAAKVLRDLIATWPQDIGLYANVHHFATRTGIDLDE